MQRPIPHVNRRVPQKFLPLPVIHDHAPGPIARRVLLESRGTVSRIPRRNIRRDQAAKRQRRIRLARRETERNRQIDVAAAVTAQLGFGRGRAERVRLPAINRHPHVRVERRAQRIQIETPEIDAGRKSANRSDVSVAREVGPIARLSIAQGDRCFHRNAVAESNPTRNVVRSPHRRRSSSCRAHDGRGPMILIGRDDIGIGDVDNVIAGAGRRGIDDDLFKSSWLRTVPAWKHDFSVYGVLVNVEIVVAQHGKGDFNDELLAGVIRRGPGEMDGKDVAVTSILAG